MLRLPNSACSQSLTTTSSELSPQSSANKGVFDVVEVEDVVEQVLVVKVQEDEGVVVVVVVIVVVDVVVDLDIDEVDVDDDEDDDDEVVVVVAVGVHNPHSRGHRGLIMYEYT